MATTDLRTVTRRFYDEVFTQGNLDVIDELAHDDFVEHEELPGLPPGKEGLRFFATAMREAFPDLTVSVEDIIVEDNKAASRVRFSGTQRGEFLGIPPTDPCCRTGADSSCAIQVTVQVVNSWCLRTRPVGYS